MTRLHCRFSQRYYYNTSRAGFKEERLCLVGKLVPGLLIFGKTVLRLCTDDCFDDQSGKEDQKDNGPSEYDIGLKRIAVVFSVDTAAADQVDDIPDKKSA